MKESTKRKVEQFLIGIIIGLVIVGTDAVYRDLTVHAQKPAEQPANQSITPSQKDSIVFTPYMEELLGEYVEQHCVAVLTEKHDVHHKLAPSGPIDDRTEWDENVPEQVLKLRCTPDKEHK